jgi:hypothetical protein
VRVRRIALSTLLVAAVVVPAGPGLALAASKSAAAVSASSKSSKGDHSGHESKKPKKKAPRPVKFAASGTVTAVDATAGTVTVRVKGGTKDGRGSTVAITVPPTARIVVNGAKKSLADIAVGFGITVTGTSADGVRTAARIEARGKKSGVKPTPAPTASPTPTDDPTDDPTTPTDDPTTDDSTPTATPTPSATS